MSRPAKISSTQYPVLSTADAGMPHNESTGPPPPAEQRQSGRGAAQREAARLRHRRDHELPAEIAYRRAAEVPHAAGRVAAGERPGGVGDEDQVLAAADRG